MTADSVRQPCPEEPPGSASDGATWLALHGDALFRFARARLGDRALAEDLVQETLLAALQARDRFQERSSVRTWLLSILRHKIADAYRRGEAAEGHRFGGRSGVAPRAFSADGFWRDAPSRWKNPERALLDEEFWRVLDGCLADLPGPLSVAFSLRTLEQAEVPEICERLELTPGNLRVRLHRARLLLRECLERKWFGSRYDEAPGER